MSDIQKMKDILYSANIEVTGNSLLQRVFNEITLS